MTGVRTLGSGDMLKGQGLGDGAYDSGPPEKSDWSGAGDPRDVGSLKTC